MKTRCSGQRGLTVDADDLTHDGGRYSNRGSTGYTTEGDLQRWEPADGVEIEVAEEERREEGVVRFVGRRLEENRWGKFGRAGVALSGLGFVDFEDVS